MVLRPDQEIPKRKKVVRIFPGEAFALRLIGALLAQQYEELFTGRRYFDMKED